MMSDSEILLPEQFRRPRFFGEYWLNQRTWWTEADKKLLADACSLKIDVQQAANVFGRAPKTIANKAKELRLLLPDDWYILVNRSPRIGRSDLLCYPYIIRATEKHADLIAVNKLVSQSTVGREDICQDILIAMWQSRVSLDDLRKDPSSVRRFAKEFRKAAFERSGHGVESMDVLLDDGRSKYENERYQRTLEDHDDSFLEEIILHGSSHRYQKNFEDAVTDAISNEEEALGVPAAMWNSFSYALPLR